MKCFRVGCTSPTAWLIGTARVPYCEKHGSAYPLRNGKAEIQRERVIKEKEKYPYHIPTLDDWLDAEQGKLK